MSKLNIGLKIVDTQAKIKGGLLGAIDRSLRGIFQNNQPRIEADVINMVINSLVNSPELESLANGKLRLDFGLEEDPTEAIINAVANSVKVEYRNLSIKRFQFVNALTIYIQPNDFNNLLASSPAQQLTRKGESLPWLEWLLLAGDEVVVANYHVVYKRDEDGEDIWPTSRTGEALMYQGGTFKVDSQFSGTIDNNFISRALQGKENQLIEIIKKHI